MVKFCDRTFLSGVRNEQGQFKRLTFRTDDIEAVILRNRSRDPAADRLP